MQKKLFKNQKKNSHNFERELSLQQKFYIKRLLYNAGSSTLHTVNKFNIIYRYLRSIYIL